MKFDKLVENVISEKAKFPLKIGRETFDSIEDLLTTIEDYADEVWDDGGEERYIDGLEMFVDIDGYEFPGNVKKWIKMFGGEDKIIKWYKQNM